MLPQPPSSVTTLCWRSDVVASAAARILAGGQGVGLETARDRGASWSPAARGSFSAFAA